MRPRQPLAPGATVGQRYRVEKLIGQGRFWLTYVADDPESDGLVVLKEYMPADVAVRESGTQVHAAGPEEEDLFDWGRAHFLEEATSLRGLEIPGLAGVDDTIQEYGTAYLVREYIPGQSLLDWLDQLGRRPTQADLDRITTRLLSTLSALHKAKLIHHDITPDHILLRQHTHEPVLIDFGGARSAFASRARALHTYIRPGYSPPEQHMFDSSTQGPWTDVFALGASLYRAVTARSPTDVIARNIRDDMPKAAGGQHKQYRPMFLQALDSALFLAPGARPQTIEEFALRLLAIPEPEKKAAPAERKKVTAPRSRRPLPARPSAAVATGGLSFSPPVFAFAALMLAAVAGVAIRLSQTPVPLDAPIIVSPGNGADSDITSANSREALLGILRTNPAQRAAAERRLKQLGYINAGVPEQTAWVRPGSGKSFRDCPTCPELVAVPAGNFLMGSPVTEEGRGDDEDDAPGPGGAQVHVAMPEPFAIGRFEVTRGEFAEFVRATGYKMDGGCYARVGSWQLVADLGWQSTGYAQDDRHPVACVSWHDAEAYVRWLGDKTGRSYRLPSEAEWEYAARGVTTATPQPRFPFGNDDRQLCDYGNGADLSTRPDNPGWQIAECMDAFAATAPVGRFKPNAFGIYDMLGNVWEWTADCWRESLARDPRSTPGCAADAPHTLRGGSWGDPPRMLRPAARIASAPAIRDQIAGFRIARGIPP